MAFLGIKSKAERNIETNNANKMTIISLIQSTQVNCKNMDASNMLRNLQIELQSQGETSKEEAIKIDKQIKVLLAEANKYILKQQYPTAIIKLTQAQNLAVDRHQYCLAGGTMLKGDKKAADKANKILDEQLKELESTRSRAEKIQEQINEKQAELDGFTKEYEKLKKLNQENPGNMAIRSQASTIVMKMKALQNSINTFSIELQKENTDVAIATAATESQTLVGSRQYSDVQTQINRDNLVAANNQMQQTQNQIASDMALFNSMGGAVADPFADPFGDSLGMGAVMADPFADPFGTQNAQSAQSQYGGFNASPMGTVEMANDIKRQSREIQRSIDEYTEKIDEASEDLEDYNSQLRPLLDRRKTASPSDCLVLDGQIDQINAKRSNVIYKIKRYRQAVSQMSDQLSLLDKLSTQQDLTATNERIKQLTSGKFSDYEGLAMYLNDSVKQSNEELEAIGIAVSVSESEDVLMASASAASAALTDSGTTKDEHKYDALENEIRAVSRPMR